jgi:hypothetical protein
MNIAKIKQLFLYAGISGVLAIAPVLLLNDIPGIVFTDAMKDQHAFRKFNLLGALLVQFLIIWISFNPLQRRSLIPIPIIEKLLAVVALPALFLLGCQIEPLLWIVPLADGILGILFYLAYKKLTDLNQSL